MSQMRPYRVGVRNGQVILVGAEPEPFFNILGPQGMIVGGVHSEELAHHIVELLNDAAELAHHIGALRSGTT